MSFLAFKHLGHLAAQYADGIRILSDWLGDGAVAVDQPTAQKRADICLSCPLNKPGFRVTEAVAAAIKEQVEMKNKMAMHVDCEHELHTCRGCLCHLPLKIWLPKERLLKYATPEELGKYDPRCWVTNNAIE